MGNSYHLDRILRWSVEIRWAVWPPTSHGCLQLGLHITAAVVC